MLNQTQERALKTLHQYNRWRRGSHMPMPEPKDIGIAIDTAIRTLRWLRSLGCYNQGLIQSKKADIKPIRNRAEHNAALEAVNSLLDKENVSGLSQKEQDKLEALVILIENYEEAEFRERIAKATPIDAIEFALDQRGLSRDDLATALGSIENVHAVLSGKMELTLEMIRNLRDLLNIPADVLI